MSGIAVPDNLVAFGAAKTGLTRAVRQLVGSGIQSGAFSQRTIRDMRQWFFAQKVHSTFTVKLDPQLPIWLEGLLHHTGELYGQLPISLTPEMAALPGFDWRDAALREYRARYLTYCMWTA